jgi:rod shape-determining protein MreC
VAQITNDPATGFYLLKLRTATNFTGIQQVFVVENLQREEQLQLSNDTEKKMEQQKAKQR